MIKNQEKSKLSQEDLDQLVGFFSLLIKMDERNKREGRYDKMPSGGRSTNGE